MFYLQEPSWLELQRCFQQTIQSNNLSTVFGVEQIPANSLLRERIDSHDYEALLEVYGQWFHRLRQAKLLKRYRFLDGHYLGYPSTIRAISPQSRPVAPNAYVIPLAPEFTRNTDGTTVQDC